MGLFSGRYTKEGPGVSKDAPEKHRFFLFFELFFRKFTKLLWLNFIYFVTLLPLIGGVFFSVQIHPDITNAINNGVFDGIGGLPLFVFTGDIVGLALVILSIFVTGPATAGFTYVLRNFQREEHAWVFSDFREHFRKNYKQGVLMGLIDVVMTVLLYVAFTFYVYYMPQLMPDMGVLSTIGATLIVIISVLFIFMHFYIYVMMVTFRLTFKQLLHNAFLFALGRLPVNILVFVIVGAIAVGWILLLPLSVIAAPILLLSLIGYITVFAVYPSIDRLMIQKSDDTDDTDAEEVRDFTDTI